MRDYDLNRLLPSVPDTEDDLWSRTALGLLILLVSVAVVMWGTAWLQ